MEPVVYDFAINERGTQAALLRGGDALMPAGYYTLMVPALLRAEARAALARAPRRAGPLRRRLPRRARVRRHGAAPVRPPAAARRRRRRRAAARAWTSCSTRNGFDRVQHEQIQADLRAGRIGLAQNRLPAEHAPSKTSRPDDVVDASRRTGRALSRSSAWRRWPRARWPWSPSPAASAAAGPGRRRRQGAATRSQARRPASQLHRGPPGQEPPHRPRVRRAAAARRHHQLPHARRRSTSYLRRENNYGYPGPLLLSPGRAIGLRLVPMERDLRFAWEEMPQQLLDEQTQKVRESLHAALIDWAQQAGEGSDYTDNLPMQCLHPVGHWYEVPNLLRNGVLRELLARAAAAAAT